MCYIPKVLEIFDLIFVLLKLFYYLYDLEKKLSIHIQHCSSVINIRPNSSKNKHFIFIQNHKVCYHKSHESKVFIQGFPMKTRTAIRNETRALLSSSQSRSQLCDASLSPIQQEL